LCSDPQAACGRRALASATEALRKEASGCERSRPRSQPGLSSAPARLSTRLSGGIALAGHDPIDALAVRLLGFKLQPELLAPRRPRSPAPSAVASRWNS